MNTCVEYLREQGRLIREQQAQAEALAARIGIPVEQLADWFAWQRERDRRNGVNVR